VKAMRDNGLEPTTVRTRYRNVRNAPRAAVRDRFMARDIGDRVRLPRVRKASLGHSSPSVTLDTYSDLWPDANDRTRNAAAGSLDQALGASADASHKTPSD
jgi:hypothetical protein